MPQHLLTVSFDLNRMSPWFDQCRRAFNLKQEAHIRWNRDRYRVNWEEFVCCRELMKLTRRPSVSLVTETEMFLWMPSPLITGGPLLRLLCSSWVRYCHRLLVRVLDWCESRLVSMICCQIILTASSPGSLLICRSLTILLPLPSGRMRSGVSC